MSNFDTPILVTGIPRSGTSMVAGTLAQCGIWTGTTAAELYEHMALRECVEKPILRSMGVDALGVTKLPTVPPTATFPGLAEIVRTYLEYDNYQGEKWSHKGCKLALMWPLWVDAFPEAQWVVCRRPREKIIQSCLSTSFMNQHSTDPDFWDKWCGEYDYRLTELILMRPDTVVVDSQRWSVDADYVEEVVEFLGLDYQEDKVRAFIKPDRLRRA